MRLRKFLFFFSNFSPCLLKVNLQHLSLQPKDGRLLCPLWQAEILRANISFSTQSSLIVSRQCDFANFYFFFSNFSPCLLKVNLQHLSLQPKDGRLLCPLWQAEILRANISFWTQSSLIMSRQCDFANFYFFFQISHLVFSRSTSSISPYNQKTVDYSVHFDKPKYLERTFHFEPKAL